MVAYKTVMPGSVPGTITRWQPPPAVEPKLLHASTPPTAFGQPVKDSSGAMSKLATNDAGSSVIGFIVRAFPGAPATANEGLGTATPNNNYPGNLLRRGYLSVYCLGSTAPAAEGQVYVRVRDNGSTSRAVGTIEAASGAFAATAAAAASNTGNATIAMGGTPTSTGVVAGVYRIIMLSATQFEIADPTGIVYSKGVAGTPVTGPVQFTVTAGGTALVPGDQFTITVVADCEAIANCFFTGGRDGNNITEIRLHR